MTIICKTLAITCHEISLETLPITIAHTATIINLPFHHKDPFDRLLIAQAIVEDISIISTDRIFDSYPVDQIW